MNIWRMIHVASIISTWGLDYECCKLRARQAREWQCCQTMPLLRRHQYAYRTCRRHCKFYANPHGCFPSNPNMPHPLLCLLLRLLSPISAARNMLIKLLFNLLVLLWIWCIKQGKKKGYNWLITASQKTKWRRSFVLWPGLRMTESDARAVMIL